MRVLLVRPPVPRHTMGLKHIMICEPLELEYVAAGLDEHEVEILDLLVERGFEARLRKFQPDVIGTSCYITGVNEVIRLCRSAKRWNPDCFTVVGGVHASQAPNDFVDDSVNCIVRGDGTTILPEVLAAYQEGRDLRQIPGLVLPNIGEDATHTAARKYMPDPNLLPLPRRDLVAHLAHRYYYLQHRPVATLKTTWGCWYKCNFCFTWRITDGVPYSRDPESIVEEIASIDSDEIYIVDDIFLINRRRLSRIANLLREKRIRKRYLVYARADFISQNEDVIREWAELGLRAVFIGLEAVTNPELDSMDKHTTVDHNRDAVRVLRRHGIDTYGSIITQPEYGPDDWERVWDFVEENQLYYLNISPLTPLPGTAVWEEFKDRLTVPAQAHGLFDLSHILLPTRVPLRDYYRSLLKLYIKSCMNFRRAGRVALRDRPSVVSRSFLRLWWGAFKIWWQMRNAHRHHEPREIERAISRGPEWESPSGTGRTSGVQPTDAPNGGLEAPIAPTHDNQTAPRAESEARRVPLPARVHVANRPSPRPDAESELLNTPSAKRWIERIERSLQQDTYTFQNPLEERTGAQEIRGARKVLQLSSYDYLGLLGHPAIEAAAHAAIDRFGTGAGGVRLLTGTNSLHTELEGRLADLKGSESALVFASGYDANLAAITSLFGPRDEVFMDARAHRSLADACRLSGPRVRRFRHGDLDHLEHLLRRTESTGRRLIAVDGVYSMDGDVCPLLELVELKSRYGAFLLVDEAHAIGVLGESGAGSHAHWNVSGDQVDVWTGSLSKAVPSSGGFVAGSRRAMLHVQHASAPFVFSAALSPASCGAAIAALDTFESEPLRFQRLWTNAEFLRNGLRELGFDTGESTTPLVPVIFGADETTLDTSRRLLERGISAAAVVSPAVAEDGARLRLCATAGHTRDDLQRALDILGEISFKPESRHIHATKTVADP